MLDGKPWFSYKLQIGKSFPHRSKRKHTAGLQGSHGEIKAGYRPRERQDLERMLLLGFVGGVLWSSWAKVGSVNSN